jgi:hypothetical protein
MDEVITEGAHHADAPDHMWPNRATDASRMGRRISITIRISRNRPSTKLAGTCAKSEISK